MTVAQETLECPKDTQMIPEQREFFRISERDEA